MPLTIELIADHDFGGFTARIPDIPAYGEGSTEEEAISDLKEALVGYIETFGIQETSAQVLQPELRQVDWTLPELTRG